LSPLIIEATIPEDDDDPKPKKKSTGSSGSRSKSPSGSSSSPSASSSSSSRRSAETGEIPEPQEKTVAEKAEIADKMKMRYGMEAEHLKFEELPAKRTGAKKHRTGGR